MGPGGVVVVPVMVEVNDSEVVEFVRGFGCKVFVGYAPYFTSPRGPLCALHSIKKDANQQSIHPRTPN